MRSFIILTIVLFPLSLFAQIGITEIQFKDTTRNRIINTVVFYPTSETNNSTFAENIVFQGFNAVRQSQVSGRNLPLFFLVHGTSGNWKNNSWLATELAKKAVVVSANFPGYTTGEATPESVLKPWNQPKDVSFLIDKMLESSFAKNIDKDTIVVIGHSLGGYTALALAGAKIDLSLYQSFCENHSDRSCTYFRKALKKLSSTTIESARQNLFDSRVKAAIAIAPGFTESMSRRSLEKTKTPILIISAENDVNVPASTHLLDIPENIKQFQIKEASHFSFLQLCKPGAEAILSKEGAEFVCIDGGKRSRTEIHMETIKIISNFLLENVSK